MVYPPGNDHISHQSERKLIFPTSFEWDMLVPRRVDSFQDVRRVITTLYNINIDTKKSKTDYALGF